ncbi:DoxX family protein [Xanthobacter autotrophicus]|uniref:DoxX family protein n=1 Tax=Xanthobacter autotrophicus TaxID=280 RepID=UPI0024A66A6D|nr:DoxX family protein [Xanthobacter autotrophicus]MDI4657709.1 DoxX family protein [Xanthobacter autotrophicus]
MVVIRLVCGLFYFPHSISKIIGFAGSVGFFTRAGFYPPEFFVVLSIVMELICAVGLTFGVFTKYLGVVSAGLMVVAAYAMVVTRGPGWFWAQGGIEYLVFWGVASLAVALDAWNKNPGFFGLFAWPLKKAKPVAA